MISSTTHGAVLFIVDTYFVFCFSEEAAIDMLLKKAFSKEIKIESESDLAVKLNLS